MTYCPSYDWDREIERAEAAAVGSVVTEINAMAAALLPAILSNPAQFTADMAVDDMVELAFEAAASLMKHQNLIDNGGTRYITVSSASFREEAKEAWESAFWAKHGEDLLP